MHKWIIKAIGIWFLFVIAAILNGTARNAFITPRVGEYTGHIISCFTGSILIFLICFALIKTLGFTKPSQFITVGLLWVILAVAFEFPFGHYVIGHPWSTLLADYNIFNGRLWVLVLITTFVSPIISAKLRGLL